MNVETLMEYVWTPFVALGFYLFKGISNRLTTIEHDMNLYVTKSYVQEEIKPDLIRLEAKMDKLVEQTADVIGRAENVRSSQRRKPTAHEVPGVRMYGHQLLPWPRSMRRMWSNERWRLLPGSSGTYP